MSQLLLDALGPHWKHYISFQKPQAIDLDLEEENHHGLDLSLDPDELSDLPSSSSLSSPPSDPSSSSSSGLLDAPASVTESKDEDDNGEGEGGEETETGTGTVVTQVYFDGSIDGDNPSHEKRDFLVRIRMDLESKPCDMNPEADDLTNIEFVIKRIRERFCFHPEIDGVLVSVVLASDSCYFDLYAVTNNYVEEETDEIQRELVAFRKTIKPKVPPRRPKNSSAPKSLRLALPFIPSLAVYSGRDPEWEYLHESVFPTKEHSMWMYCRDKVKAMKEQGDLPNALRTISHSFEFRSVAERKEFASKMEEKGFTTMISAKLPTLLEDGSVDPQWKANSFVLKAQREDCASVSYLFNVVCEILEILAPYDAEYQGWSSEIATSIPRDPLADQVLLA